MLVDKATIHIPNHIVGKRDINHVLLEEKANFYKNNQFSQERFEKFARNQKSPPKFKLMKRDINLDMLKKKIKSEGSWGKPKPVTQPEFLRKYWDEPEDTFRMKDHYNDELFKNSMDSDELTMENLGVEEDIFPNFATSDEDWYYKNQFQPKQKQKPQKLNLDMDRRWMPISIRNRNGPSKFSEVYREELDIGKVKKIKLPWFESQKKNKYPWEDTYGYNGQKNRDMSVFNGLDELNFYDDLDYAFARKRRALLNTIAKDGPMKFKKNDIKKLGKHTIQKNKVPCKNCLKEKKQKSNVQVLLNDKHDKRNKTLDDLIAEADINENTIPPPRSKRSLLNNELPFLFGQYRPLTLDLKPWQPVDVLTLVKDHPSLLPLYALIQEQNLKNSLMHPRYFELRRKRFIDQKRLDSLENSIALKTESRKGVTEEKIEWNKNNGVTEKNDDGKGNVEWEIVSGDLKKENVNNVEQQTANKRITKLSNLDNEPDVNQNILQKNIDKKITNLGEENTEIDEKTTEDISEIKKLLLDDIRRKLEERYNLRHFISEQDDEQKDDKYDQDGELLKSRHNIEVNNEEQTVRRNKYLESNNDLSGAKENSIFKEKYENTNADPLNILQKVVKKNILKAARENLIEKEKLIESQMNDLEATRQTTLNAIKNGVLRRNDVNNKDNIVSRIPTFLEKVLGQSNAKPIENLMETVKKSIKQMNVNLNNFITRLF
ncbi:uncharacterized protein LOC115880254 [Sitophilus oryzae]|uniref:Uncharacterized protein LOC115880254 n=1 Tax=Sitophilus oryzae TaxID=7048 RepID=A0A6J2XPJ6_SITOR|nr:uncharacterized protein LOC115880254 [Sitophilus oryzae]